MQDKNKRTIRHYYVVLSDSEPEADHTLDLRTLLTDLLPSVSSGSVFHKAGKIGEERVFRLLDMVIDGDVATLLWQYGDKKVEPQPLIHLDTGAARRPEQLPPEAPGAQAHMVIHLNETESGSRTYAASLEHASRVNIGRIKPLLQRHFTQIGASYERARPDGSKSRPKPVLEIDLAPSKSVRQALTEGRWTELVVRERVVLQDYGRPNVFRDQFREVVFKPGPNRDVESVIEGLKAAIRSLRNPDIEHVTLRVDFGSTSRSGRIPVNDVSQMAEAAFVDYDVIEADEAFSLYELRVDPTVSGLMQAKLRNRVRS